MGIWHELVVVIQLGSMINRVQARAKQRAKPVCFWSWKTSVGISTALALNASISSSLASVRRLLVAPNALKEWRSDEHL